MRVSTVVNILAALLGVVAFLLVPFIADHYTGPEPSSSQLVHFVIISVFESIGIIAGVIFAYRARSLLRNGLLSALTYFSVFWLLVSWWPHDRAHPLIQHNDYNSLIIIEYVFHVTLILSAVVVAIWVTAHKPYRAVAPILVDDSE